MKNRFNGFLSELRKKPLKRLLGFYIICGSAG
jgi:hypothetical protein